MSFVQIVRVWVGQVITSERVEVSKDRGDTNVHHVKRRELGEMEETYPHERAVHENPSVAYVVVNAERFMNELSNSASLFEMGSSVLA